MPIQDIPVQDMPVHDQPKDPAEAAAETLPNNVLPNSLPTLLPMLLPSKQAIVDLKTALAAAAQAVYDAWNVENGDGADDDLNGGGICQDIAAAHIDVLMAHGIEPCVSFCATVGEQHVYAVVLCQDGVYSVDINPYLYESGSGYCWRKKPDVSITADDVEIFKVMGPMDSETFLAAYQD